eukprot:gnl/TRDRNA2_/TRDRNA2_174554_c0_seq2.p1 gnl/TRDRNA2_/TRDRNA2_174554_c0~~gnl/TRDRNA2_/TRDRNA2_174554_c0_seq2.p1  ORF type:complete len:418 (-),score=68.60 gnl/TRDRNA2_/TRDRNA2_174554_c0_seq2:35-1288(-)
MSFENADDNAGLAFGLVIAAGLSTGVGAAAVYFKQVVQMASKPILATGLGFSGGVMLYVSFIEIFQKSVGAFTEHGHGESDAYLCATVCFFAGIVAMKLIGAAVHRLDSDHNHCQDLPEADSIKSSCNAACCQEGGSLPCLLPHEAQVLLVESRNAVQNYAGRYVAAERVNGFPLWKRADGDSWIYSGEDGSWKIGGSAEQEQNFKCSTGFASTGLHAGRMPDEFEGKWQRNDGMGEAPPGERNPVTEETKNISVWIADSSIAVVREPTAVPSAGQQESAAKEQTSEAAVAQSSDAALKRMGLNTALAIGLHNFPEGLATFVATLAEPAVGVTLAVAIAIHNIPEGLCVALPIYYSSGSRHRGFFWALLSGISAPVGACIGYAIVKSTGDDLNQLVYGTLFGLVAGMMGRSYPDNAT